MKEELKDARIHVTGIVQGVGFRPFVYNLAVRYGLTGYCLNDSEGVVIEVHGASTSRFIAELKDTAPPLSRIESITVSPVAGQDAFTEFSIRESVREEGKSVLVSPDVSVCSDCLRELADPADRRHLYPFINCTNCGPRYTIVKDIPYDRPLTTMAPFALCAECEAEYNDPANRRFHAQPNACAACGPEAWLASAGDVEPANEARNFDAIRQAQRLLKDGAIVAIKGLGGFHLACDAENDESVMRLRREKRKSLSGDESKGSNKPFALMALDVEAVERFASVSSDERALLEGRTRPIVLLEKLAKDALSPNVAPGNRCFGVMLPYTPLHYLLFRDAGFTALVMTSGNLADEPIVTSNAEAAARLSGISEWMLLHDRDIYMRADDSIARVETGKPRLVRRARGYTPGPIELFEEMDEILACGAELKNTFCITKGSRAIPGTHIGDLKNHAEMEFFSETLSNLKKTFRANPTIVAHDLHPDYLSTRFALDYARKNSIPPERVVAVQHHHAHIASCMAERSVSGPVIGVALDGTGLGADGNIWGGEFMTATLTDFTREAHLGYVRLPGGDRAVMEPWRMAVSHLVNAFGVDATKEAAWFFEKFPPKEVNVVLKMISSGLNSPLTSSMGRLFDAVASLTGLRDRITFEAEAAIELEAGAESNTKESCVPYPFEISGQISGAATDAAPLVIDVRPMIRAIASDVRSNVPVPLVSGRFHSTVVEMIIETAKRIRSAKGLKEAALSGGVFQNALLSSMAGKRLAEEGFIVHTHERVPANDGGVSLGQAAVAWARVKGG